MFLEPQMNADERRYKHKRNRTNAFTGIASASPYLRLSAFICGFILLGCANEIKTGKSTALSGIDLIEMTDDMAMKIAGDADVQTEMAKVGPLKIVVEPVENEMTAEVLPRGPAEAFTGRVRSLLSKHDRENYIWVMNRDAFYRMRNQELDFDLGLSPDAINPQYALTAKFSSLTDENAKRRSAYYLCVYQLTDLTKRRILWTDKYEVKKATVKGWLD